MRFDTLELTKRGGDEIANHIEPRVRNLAHQLLLLNLVGKHDSDDYKKLKNQFNDLKEDYLISKNIRLVLTIAPKFKNLNDIYVDIVSVGLIGFVKAVRTFNPYKRKNFTDRKSFDSLDLNKALSTYIGKCVENEIKMYARKLKRQVSEVSMNAPIAIDHDGNELTLEEMLESHPTPEEEVFDKLLLNKIKDLINNLPLKYRKIAEERVIQEDGKMSQEDLAEKLGISRSYVSRLEKRIEKMIKEQLKKD